MDANDLNLMNKYFTNTDYLADQDYKSAVNALNELIKGKSTVKVGRMNGKYPIPMPGLSMSYENGNNSIDFSYFPDISINGNKARGNASLIYRYKF